MNILEKSYLESVFPQIKETLLSGRYIHLDHIRRTFDHIHAEKISYQQIGHSEFNRSIYQFRLGKGSIKILIWTQMHGNESTGTKAVFDFFKYIQEVEDPFSQGILENCEIRIVPILNPDGALAYTRVNGKGVDLNRDAVDKQAIESRILRETLDNFKPDFCFNLHDQRTIFGVEGTSNPATISFLAPSEEVSRKITEGRKTTMNIIVAMDRLLQQMIPGHVGRYTDEFYPTATGDNFQKLGYPTILIESGHYKDDYEREEVRKYTFSALLQGIYHIATASNFDEHEDYFNIPNNQKSFLDLLHKYPNHKNQAFQFEEVLENNRIKFVPKKVKKKSSDIFFHKEIVFADEKS